MALAGSLKEFGLADILQLIHYQRKTGVLSVQSRLDSVKLFFNEGNIVHAESKKRNVENRLGRVLVKRNVIKADELKSAIEEHRKSGARLGAVLIKRRLVTKEQLQEVLTFQITETAVQLFSWKEGKYEFKPEGVPVDKNIGLSLSTQHLLMEGLRLLDEWTLIEGKISVDSVFERRATEAEVELTREESQVLNCVDGTADVSSIADLSGMDSFQVSKTLLQLLDKGLVVKKEAPGAEPAAYVAPVAVKRTGAFKVLVAAILVAAFASAFVSYPHENLRLDKFRALEDIDRLSFEIEAEKAERGSYPPSIKAVDPWGSGYIYVVNDDGFTLLSAGPDRRAGTEDDVY